MAVIRTDHLSKTYRDGSAALQGLTLEVEAGEVFGLLGPNGAGKTTTIHLLLDFIRPSEGAAFVFERPVSDPAIRRRIGYLPESVTVPDYYRGGQLLQYYAALLGLPPALRQARGSEVLELLGLQEARDKRVATYSKGMLQRLGFAQALLNDPDLLILDEPTANLDPVGRKAVRDLLLARKRRGKTVFLSSHILSEMEGVCDRVAIVQNGQVNRIGTLQQLSRTSGTRIFVPHLPVVLVEMLGTTTARVMLEQGQATILCPDLAVRHQVEQLLAQHGIEIQRIEAETQSLEDIFLSALQPLERDSLENQGERCLSCGAALPVEQSRCAQCGWTYQPR
jgi:ABC-2 type transport system ATP-binding protein